MRQLLSLARLWRLKPAGRQPTYPVLTKLICSVLIAVLALPPGVGAHPPPSKPEPCSGSECDCGDGGWSGGGPGGGGIGGGGDWANPRPIFQTFGSGEAFQGGSARPLPFPGGNTCRGLSCPGSPGGGGGGAACCSGEDHNQLSHNDDPVHLGTMSVYLKAVELSPLPQPGGVNSATPAFGRYYTGNRPFGSTLGNNWTHNYYITLHADGPYVKIRDWKAMEMIFIRNGDVYDGGDNVNGGSTLTKDENGNFVWALRHGTKYTFNAADNHRLATITDRLGNALTLSYDGNGRLSGAEDQHGRALTFVHDNYLLTQVIDPLNRTNFYSYNNPVTPALLTNVSDALGFKAAYEYVPGSAWVQKITDARGHSHSYAYDGVGQVIAFTNALLHETRYGIDPVNHSVAITNANGHVSTNYFDEDSRLIKIEDAAGVTEFIRDGSGRVNARVDRLGQISYFVRDPGSCACGVSGGLLMSIDPLDRTNLWAYHDTFHLPTRFTNALGGITAWTYDHQGVLTNTLDALGKTNKFVVDNFGNPTQAIDALDRTNHFAYDHFGNLTNTIDALDRTNKFKYDLIGRLTHRTDALGFTNGFEFDARDRLTRQTDALGRTNSWAYDANGNIIGQTNALGHVTTNAYNALNRLISVTLPGDASPFTSYAYDGNGNLVGVTNALNHATRYGYDALDRNTSVTNALGHFWVFAYDAESRLTNTYDALGFTNRFVYDAVGRLLSQTNPLGHGTWFAYDLLDRRTGVTNVLGKAWRFAYDAVGRMTNSTDPNLHNTWFTYDAAGQLRFTTNALEEFIEFEYDPVGNRTNIIDGRGNPLGFAYDGLNRLTNLVYAASDSERFAYDAVGNLTNYTSRAGEQIKFLYDRANRLTNKTHVVPFGSGPVITFGYDAADRLTNALWKLGSFTNSHVTFTYDPAGRLTNETQKIGTTQPKSVRYEYDTAGRKTKMTYPDNTSITYGYNANGWLVGISNANDTAIVIYEYDNAGRRKKRTLENDTITEYGYDAADQMTSIAHKKTDLTPISSFAYGYDDAGQRKWVKRGNGYGDVYKYDATDQLTNVLYEASSPDTSPSGWTNDVRYGFDAAGNRSSVVTINGAGTATTSYTANELNQYTNIGGLWPGHDQNGNLNYDGSVWTYNYDRENRLTDAEKDGGSTWIYYRYDAFNRLIERVSSSGGTTRFYYDDQWRLIAEYDGSGNLLAKYVYGPEIDEPVRMTDSADNKYYYHAAALGTVTEITDPSGDLVERYTYDVYGEPTFYDSTFNPQPSTAIGNRLLFQGRDRDPATGLYNFRNRYYSPGLGRFVQVDPIREKGGLNLYAFVLNDPLNHIDPHGKNWFANWLSALVCAYNLLIGNPCHPEENIPQPRPPVQEPSPPPPPRPPNSGPPLCPDPPVYRNPNLGFPPTPPSSPPPQSPPWWQSILPWLQSIPIPPIIVIPIWMDPDYGRGDLI